MKKTSWPTKFTLYAAIGLVIAILGSILTVHIYRTVICGQSICAQTYPLQCTNGVCAISTNEADLYLAILMIIVGAGIALAAAYKDWCNRKAC